MKKYPLILLVSFFVLTACQEEKIVDKSSEMANTTEVNRASDAKKIEVATVSETKVSAPTVTEEKNEEDEGEGSGAALHEKNCARCHGADYYPKKESKMDSYKRLHTMVGMCDAQLGTELFPEELQSITDHLNDSFYKFKKE
ncbi:MAG: cytochrome c [Cocleimonas sp.]|nr:cytochrome c [Cocleimonas sp.]